RTLAAKRSKPVSTTTSPPSLLPAPRSVSNSAGPMRPATKGTGKTGLNSPSARSNRSTGWSKKNSTAPTHGPAANSSNAAAIAARGNCEEPMYRYNQTLPGGAITLVGVLGLSFLMPGWVAGLLGLGRTHAMLVAWITGHEGIPCIGLWL